MYYALHPFVWNADSPTNSFYHIPNAVGLVDLRNLPDQGSPGVLGRYAFAAFHDKPPHSDAVHLGESLSADWSQQLQSSLSLGEEFTKPTLTDQLWEYLTVFADPTGQQRVKPILPTNRNELELHLGGHSLLKRQLFDTQAHPSASNVLAVERADLERCRQSGLETQGVLQREGLTEEVALARFTGLRVLSRTDPDVKQSDQYKTLARILSLTPPDHHRCVLSALMEKYHCEPGLFSDYPPLPHSTTITEDWNCANADSPNCDLNWTELESADFDIISNEISHTETGEDLGKGLRVDTNLASVDHYSEASCKTTITSGSAYYGVACRMSTSANTKYLGFLDKTDTAFSRKVVTGTHTNIATPAFAHSSDTFYKVKVKLNGSTITVDVDDAEKTSDTDTAITGNVRTGLMSSVANSTDNVFDNFTGADLAAAATFTPHISIF